MCETPEMRFPWRAASVIGCDKKGRSDHPRLPFGFEIGKIVKYAGRDSDQLNLILGKNLARLLRIQPKPSENRGHHANLTTKSPDAYRRLVARKWIGLSVAREWDFGAEKVSTPRISQKLMPGPHDVRKLPLRSDDSPLSETDRPHDSAERVGEGGSGD